MGINEETVLRALLYALDAAINDKDHVSVDYFSTVSYTHLTLPTKRIV